MTARFLVEAERELFEAANAAGDERLIAAVLQVVDLLERMPNAGRLWSDDLPVRRFYVGKPWPFVVVYLPTDDELIVVAVAHTSRKPGYWRDRVAPV